jgi:beta-ribofuranosylaminobenzene 5'-phosphate synthase
MIRVVAGCRLHFGLINPFIRMDASWPGLDGAAGAALRQFGGVGLMLPEPTVIVTATPHSTWQAHGTQGERALAFARQITHQPFSICVEQCPIEHTGLGVGTALGLATARAVTRAMEEEPTAVELAVRIGRGLRSAIGVHGFERGGLIVDGGKTRADSIAPLIAHHPFPEDWQVTLHTPRDHAGWFGPRERAAFAQLAETAAPPQAEIERLCRLVLLGILPALVSHDLPAFAEAVYEYNARVGDCFAAVQGGRYSSPAIAQTIARLRSEGYRGVGQSSWGPTVFAIHSRH